MERALAPVRLTLPVFKLAATGWARYGPTVEQNAIGSRAR